MATRREKRTACPTSCRRPSETPISAAETALLARIALLPDLDWERGIKTLRGKTGTYLRLLQKYAEVHQNDMAKLRHHLATGENEDAIRIAHTLKGVSGTLGLSGLQAQATALEANLRDPANKRQPRKQKSTYSKSPRSPR